RIRQRNHVRSSPCITRNTSRRVHLGTLSLAELGGCGSGGPPEASVMGAPTQPVSLDTPPPAYPPELACFDRGGTVGLLMQIGVDGAPADIRVETSSGHPQLDQSATEAVETWKFRPATRNGNPVATDLRVPVTFSPPDVRPDMCFQYDEQR